MSEKSSLGLFLSKDRAVAVWLASGSDGAVTRMLDITPDENEPAPIALRTARTVTGGDEFDEAFVAIDCGCYTQYKLHSEFDDYHQVESTIKFDAEEAAATDAMNLAVAFDITGKTVNGAEVAVYTADRQLLTDMLLDFQDGALDPSFMEPDVVCLSRALLSETSGQTDTMYVVLSDSRCYMIRPGGDFSPAGRSLLVGQGQDVTGVLSREIMLAGGAEPLSSVVLLGRPDGVDTETLAERTGLEVRIMTQQDLPEGLNGSPDIPVHELMIAYGAALAGRTRGHKTDFRRDFMPYQGRRKVVQGSLRLIGISLTILLVSVAAYFQFKTFRMRGYYRLLREQLLDEHKAIGLKPKSGESFGSRYATLTRAINAAKRMQDGTGDDKSVPAKLTFFFEAVNKTSQGIDLRLQQVTISERSMKVKGDTKSRTSTLELLKQIKSDSRINVSSERLTAGADRRDGFEITLEPKKGESRR